MKIKTDHKWKNFVYRSEVPDKILEDQFSHLDNEYIDGFFCYHGYWYHLSDFMRIDQNSPLYSLGYSGYSSDSFFSGILIRLSNDCDKYQIATYFS